MNKSFQNPTRALLLQIMRLEGSIMHRFADKLGGIHPGQFHLLLMLSQKDGASQKELADFSCVSAPTITVMLSNMEKKGLIEKKKDPTDGRVTRIYLTSQCQDILDKIQDLQTEMNEKLLSGISKEEQLFLNRLLKQIRDNLKEVKDSEFPQLNN